MSKKARTTICIVEGDGLLRGFSRDAFEKMDCDVSAFDDPGKALEFLSNGPVVSAIITNVGSAGEGFDFVELVRQIPGYRGVSIFFRSSHSPASFERLTGIKVTDLSPNTDFIEKDEDPEQFAAMVMDVLNGAPVEGG